MSPRTTGTTVVNPLPEILRRYEDEMHAVLRRIGREPVTVTSGASGEIRGRPRREQLRIVRAMLTQPAQVRSAPPSEDVVVCWPIFGLFEPALWMASSRRRDVIIVIHDPTALKATHGTGSLAALAGRAAGSGRGPRVVVHSVPAQRDLQQRGWTRTTLLPHPILPLAAGPRRPRERAQIAVVGQYKPARDLDLLESLGRRLRTLGYDTLIAGPGWPDIPGWSVERRRLPEDELDDVIAQSAAIVVPYRHFYQSGVAVRALEGGRAIAGPRHPFLQDLYGADWPGLPAGDDVEAWIGAIEAAARVPDADVADRHETYRAGTDERWAQFLRER